MKEQTPDAQPSESAPRPHFNGVYGCNKCRGTGKYIYENTSTWRYGIGGDAMTEDVCDQCWGSGHQAQPGKNLKVPASKGVAALSEEDRKRIDQYLNETLPGYSLRAEREWVKRGIDYATKYERAKQAELVEENERQKKLLNDYEMDVGRLKVERARLEGANTRQREALEEIDKYYRIAESNDDFAMEAIQTVRAALTKTPKP